MHELILYHNSKKHPTPLLLPPSTPFSSLPSHITTHLSLPSQTTLRLIHNGKTLSQNETPISTLKPKSTIYIISTNTQQISEIRSQKPDPLLRPFNPPPARYVATPRRTRAPPSEYCFAKVEALGGFSDTGRAQAILEELASDRGFLHVMQLKRWRVGRLAEMKPEGRIGIDPVCVLGYNTNKGMEIHLRLRTDDMKGFRSMLSIRQVLCHELAHNEFSEHDNDFKELMRWIEKEVAKFDWKRKGESVGGVRMMEVGGDSGSGASGGGDMVQRLGGVEGSSRLLRESEEVKVGMEIEMDAEKSEEKSEGEMETKVDEEKANTENNTTRGSKPTEPTEPTEGKAPTAVMQLVSLGFRAELAAVALRETNRDVARAADWLLQPPVNEPRADVDEGQRNVVELIERAIERMKQELSEEGLVAALEGLHVYLGNLVRNPGVEKFCRINGENEGFKRRVGGNCAVEVLKVVGFESVDGGWKFVGRQLGVVWYAKRVVVEELVRELGKVP